MPSLTPQTLPRAFACVFVVALVALASSAQALMTITLEWTATTGSGTIGSSVIRALPGDELDLDIIATVDAAGVDSYQVSVEFDLAGLDELDLIEVIELEHVATIPCDPLIEAQLGALPACFENFGNELVNFNTGIEVETESGTGTTGLAGGFEAAAPKVGPGEGVVDLSFRVGRVRFLVTDNVATNGDDMEGTLILDNPADGYVDDSLTIFVLPEDLPSPDFTPGFARVDNPEPGAGLLAATALLALAGLARRRRSARLGVARARP